MKAEKGFTLLEIMVALAILGIALTVILQQFSAGLRSVRISREYTAAVIHAREKMEECCLNQKLAEKEETGEFEDGYKWRVVVAPFKEEKKNEGESTEFLLLTMYDIKSTVSWDGGGKSRQVELATVKVVPKEGWK